MAALLNIFTVDIMLSESEGLPLSAKGAILVRIKCTVELWEVHNRSEDHQKRDRESACRFNKTFYKFSGFFWELFATWYEDPLTYFVHKLWNEEQYQLHDLHHWRAAALFNILADSKCVILRNSWNRLRNDSPKLFTLDFIIEKYSFNILDLEFEKTVFDK